jgi:undecaprenyl-diphosphatase
MSTGILLNLDRLAAARLSFFLGLPALTGAGLYELKDATGGDTSTGALAVGTLVSFVVAYASIAWLLRFVTRHTFDSFVIYRVLVALALIGLLIGGALDA